MTPKHVDLGCGAVARHPYNHDEVHAVDLAAPSGTAPHLFRQANLSLAPVPHPDSTFDSASAFNFLEHIPRILPTPDGRSTRFPFVELMNEIHRTLKLGGQEDFVPGSALGLRGKLRKWRLKRAGRLSHLVWEFVCIKGAP